MKKTMLSVAFGLVVLLLVSTCLVAAKEGEILIKFSIANPLDPILSHESSTALVFKQVIEQKSNKRIKVQIYPSSVLGPQDEQWTMVKRGTIQMMLASVGTLSQFYPLASVHNLPFVFSSYSVARDVLDGEFGRRASEDILEKTGVKIVAYPEQGFSWLTNSKRPIRNPGDLKGLRIRSMSVPMHLKLFEALGAKSTTINWSEIYSALQVGVVDGQHNALTGITAAKLYEVQEYCTFTNHFYTFIYWAVNNEWLQNLSEGDKKILWEAVRIAMSANRGATRIREASDKGIPYLKEKGMEFYNPTPEEMEQFRKIAIPFSKKLINEILGEEGLEWREFLLEEIKKAEDRQGYFKN